MHHRGKREDSAATDKDTGKSVTHTEQSMNSERTSGETDDAGETDAAGERGRLSTIAAASLEHGIHEVNGPGHCAANAAPGFAEAVLSSGAAARFPILVL